MVLSACSTFFSELFRTLDGPLYPVVVLPGASFPSVVALLTFMYSGEVNVYEEQISTLLSLAETLGIKGLADFSGVSIAIYLLLNLQSMQMINGMMFVRNRIRKNPAPQRLKLLHGNRKFHRPIRASKWNPRAIPTFQDRSIFIRHFSHKHSTWRHITTIITAAAATTTIARVNRQTHSHDFFRRSVI